MLQLTIPPWLAIICTDMYVQVVAGVLASALLILRRPGSRFLILLLGVFTIIGFAASHALLASLHVPLWLWCICCGIPLWQFGGIGFVPYLLLRRMQKWQSLEEKAAMWTRAAVADTARHPNEVATQIQQAVTKERQQVSSRDVKRALRKAHYPRKQLADPQPQLQQQRKLKPMPKYDPMNY